MIVIDCLGYRALVSASNITGRYLFYNWKHTGAVKADSTINDS